jgi:hypothetical protein
MKINNGPFLIPCLLLILMTLFLSPVMTGPAIAEGERYDRLEVSLPVDAGETIKAEESGEKTSEIKTEVIVSAFTRVNRSLDRSTATVYAAHVLEASGEFGVHPFMIASLIIRESTVKQNARSRHAYGLMQINWKAHRASLKKAFSAIQTLDDLLQPRNNILAGTWIFSWYLKSSGGDMDQALSKYLGRTGKKYVARVMGGFQEMLKDQERYQKKYGSDPGKRTASIAFAVE